MICPKCDEGKLKKIQFKSSKKRAFFCDFCGMFWFEDEDINELSGHAIRSYSQDEDIEYSINVDEDKDREFEPVIPIKYK